MYLEMKLSSYHFHYLQMFTSLIYTKKNPSHVDRTFGQFSNYLKGKTKSPLDCILHTALKYHLYSGKVSADKIHPLPEKLV